MTAYPCISLWQPWASAPFLVSTRGERLKAHETRSWRPPARLIGQRVAIHAAKKKVDPLDLLNRVHEAMIDALGDRAWTCRIPYGAVVGTAILTGAAMMGHGAAPLNGLDETFGDWSIGRWAWRLDDPQLLAEPIPWKGRQGWFTVDLP